MWALVALASAAIFGVVSIVDKRILDHHLPAVPVLYLWIVLYLSFYTAIALGLTGIPTDASGNRLLMAFLSGLGWGVGLALLFVGLKLEEASKATAIAQIYPVFVALLAVLFLHEQLQLLQWLAIASVVMGAMLVSWQSGPPKATGRSRLLHLSRGTPFLVGTALCLSVAYFGAKYALDGLPVWTVWCFQNLGIILVLGLLVRPKTWWQLIAALKNRRTLALMLVGEGVLPNIAGILGLLATSMGPVSLVASFLATRPLFVFIGTTVLSSARWHLMDESLARGALTLKFVSIVMIIVGVGALGLL